MHERKIDSAVDAVTLGRPGVKSAETSTNLFSPHFVTLAARWTLIAHRQTAGLFKVSHPISS
jgi:hypothetical protein